MPSLSASWPPAPRNAAGLAALAAAALLAAAFAMEHLGGLAPCSLCVWQRWPHGAAVLLGGLALLPAVPDGGRRALLGLCTVAFAATAGIGAYHVGVEQGVFAGPTACSAAVGGKTVEELRRALTAAPVVRCDEVAWSLFGISLAGYNVLVSAALALFSGGVALRGRKRG